MEQQISLPLLPPLSLSVSLNKLKKKCKCLSQSYNTEKRKITHKEWNSVGNLKDRESYKNRPEAHADRIPGGLFSPDTGGASPVVIRIPGGETEAPFPLFFSIKEKTWDTFLGPPRADLGEHIADEGGGGTGVLRWGPDLGPSGPAHSGEQRGSASDGQAGLC